MHVHVCVICGKPHAFAWLAANCCDPISNDLDVEAT